MRAIVLTAFLLLLCGAVVSVAFDGDRVTEGSLTMAIEPIDVVEEYDQPVPVTIRLENKGEAEFAGSVEIRDLVDKWRVLGKARQDFSLQPKGSQDLAFQVTVGKGAYSALYPVHAYATFREGEKECVAHAVYIVETRFRDIEQSHKEPPPLTVVPVPERGALPLWQLGTYRVAWQYFDQPLVYKPVGWQGSDGTSRANLSRGVPRTRGTTKETIGMHPPWVPRAGTMFCEYKLRLPDTKPLRLTFANAIRDNTTEEPPSDGVTFRVWVVQNGKAKVVFERHTDAKTWLPGEVDLSPFAGQTVLLRLESHPGPKRNTTCDSSYWAEPMIVAGEPPPVPSETKREVAVRRTIGAVGIVASASDLPGGKMCEVRGNVVKGVRVPVGEGYAVKIGTGPDASAVVMKPGQYGLLDAQIGIGYQDGKAVVFDGLRVSVDKQPVGTWLSPVEYKGCEAKVRDGRLIVTHRFSDREGPFTVEVRVWSEGPGLRISFESDRRITDIRVGRAHVKAPRVYYGHGYCICDPEPFRAGFGGHNLSTSHVGFDFETGVSLLQASDCPPDYLEVGPEEHIYALHTHLNATLTLVASCEGAFDCALKYRDLYDKKPAGGVERLAGRFTFDIWGGNYADIAEQMERMIRYGCTDSILTVHVWQRWGYDYRLPDIFPPNPAMGTVEDMRRIGEVCRKHDIPWGLHDNYIDFYPDAREYSYDHICFTEGGLPIKAWYNEGRKAQSYRWRPDHIMPFVQRNLRLIRPTLQPTHYFIDVFTSARCFDYYDREGRFHSMLETRRCWGEAFAWIRDFLGSDAPTTSEAGHDQLIGYLDGADCQHLTLSPTPRKHLIKLLCKDWERVPWFDAVLHDKFILHGVGYSGRYQGGRPRPLHGIISDDYITAEVLEGHPAMVDRGCWGAAAVRKYWLLQDFSRNLALRRISQVTFADGDIHRQYVTWDNGTMVWVNRGRDDWTVRGHVLPQYGYLVEGENVLSAIERINGVIVEQSRGPGGLYCNARCFIADDSLQVRPVAERVEYLGENRFRLIVRWDVQQPVPPGYVIFIHFLNRRSERSDEIVFQGDHAPEQPTEKWSDIVRTGTSRVIEVPSEWGPGTYEIVIGLHHPQQRVRAQLLGQDRDSRRYLLGKLVVEGDKGKITGIRLLPPERTAEIEEPRNNVKKTPVDFGPLVTDGACRVQIIEGGVRVTPLPDSPSFVIRLRPQSFGFVGPLAAASVTVLDESGNTVGSISLPAARDFVTLAHDGKAFAYEIRWGAAQ